MRFELIDGWQTVFTKAWSVKFSILAGLCSILEMILPAYVDGMPRGWFAAASAINAALGLGARMLAQKEITSVILPVNKE